jgi:choline-sulfatase
MTKRGLTRGELLKHAAATAPAVWLAGASGARAQTPSKLQGMNVLVFMTDQDRAIQHFPARWAQQNLPGYTRLQRHGLTSTTRSATRACARPRGRR